MAHHCNCKKSRCLKLYCDCFAAGQYCGNAQDGLPCKCNDCSNTPDPRHKKDRDAARARILARRPNAFSTALDLSTGGNTHALGCRCTRTRCLKKYCVCFNAGVDCAAHCSCEGCENHPAGDKSLGGSRRHYLALSRAPQGLGCILRCR